MALALLALSGCSDKVADMSCSDIADEAIGISKGALVSINGQKETSRTDQRVVCHGTGLFKSGKEIPVRFQAFNSDDGQILVKYDADEYQAALERRAQMEEQREQDRAVQQIQNAYNNAVQQYEN